MRPASIVIQLLALLATFIVQGLHQRGSYFLASDVRRWQCANTIGMVASAAPPSPSGGFVDGRKLFPGMIVEYTTAKGNKRLALVSKRQGGQLEVLNEARALATIPLMRVVNFISGKFEFGDLLRLGEILEEVRPNRFERLWEEFVWEEKEEEEEGSITVDGQPVQSLTCAVLSSKVFGAVDPVRLFAIQRLMASHGAVFFRPVVGQAGVADQVSSVSYVALTRSEVQTNLRDRAALRELRQRFKKATTDEVQAQAQVRGASSLEGGAPVGGTGILGQASASETVPARVMLALHSYSEGLKHLVIKSHPWVTQGRAKRAYDEELAAKGRELLEILELSPSVKNAKKVLAFTGIWPAHTNIEKYVMELRDAFPPDALEEAERLLADPQSVPDMDERIRRDLRALGTYSIDREGASEVDDAVSIETLDDGSEKLWVHIADVSRWIRPGSALSLEAERRMSSVYMPDERIPMFPEALSSDLLSLRSSADSFALSCGVTLDADGNVVSYEVCPSVVRVTRRLTYSQLDEILATDSRGQPLPPPAGIASTLSFGPDPEEVAAAERREGTGAIPSQQLLDIDLAALAAGGTTRSSSSASTSTSTITASSSSSGSTRSRQLQVDPSSRSELQRLNHWARIRHDYRMRNGALDQYLRHRTELHLSAKRDAKAEGKYAVTGYTAWSNATSISLVSEYMILMCQTVGSFCLKIGAPVWFKTQTASPPLSQSDVQLQPGEPLFLRSARIMQHLRPANDSKIPGEHCTSGSSAYVQCTSPIRRYHDLYNHYRLKAALHAGCMAEDLADLANEEAGITRLDNMATAEARLATLGGIRLVSRHREQYWLGVYIERQLSLAPRVEFDCLVSATLGPFEENLELFAAQAAAGAGLEAGSEDEAGAAASSTTATLSAEQPSSSAPSLAAAAATADNSPPLHPAGTGFLAEALILQLGSFVRYLLYHRSPQLKPGDVLKCHLCKRFTNPISYVLMPTEVASETSPAALVAQLTKKKPQIGGGGWEQS